MNFRIFGLLVSCVLASAGGGCNSQSAVTGRNKNPTVVLELAPSVSKAVATVHLGDEVRFVLPAERGPGFIWQIVGNDPRSLRQSSGMVYKAGATGAPATSSISFIAQRPSRSVVRFAYVPADGGKETELVASYNIVVTVR